MLKKYFRFVFVAVFLTVLSACDGTGNTTSALSNTTSDTDSSAFVGSGNAMVAPIPESSSEVDSSGFSSLQQQITQSLMYCNLRSLSSSSFNAPPISYGWLIDSRDELVYKTVTIGTQTWMAENIRYGASNRNDYGCSKYGLLYTWKQAAKACPSGWHLPSKDEWETLFKAVGGRSSAGTALKSTSGWSDPVGVYNCNNGADAFGFSAFPAGYFNESDGYDGCHYESGAHFWSSTEYFVNSTPPKNFALSVELEPTKDSASLHYSAQDFGYSVRCLQDDTSAQIATSSSSLTKTSSSSRSEIIGSITDPRDGQTYKAITIGSQVWMAQNLNYETDSSYCYNDEEGYCSKYGRLYAWGAAVMACPDGWHLPDTTEWMTLFKAVGGQPSAGTALKSTFGWNEYEGPCFNSCNVTDAFGFSALPAGNRELKGNYYREGELASFWSSTAISSVDIYSVHLGYMNIDARLGYNVSRNYAYSVRCILGDTPYQIVKSSSSFAESSSSESLQSSSSKVSSSSSRNRSSSSSKVAEPVEGTLTDSRDGQTYKIINIGTQTWMAQNLNYKTENSYCYENDASNCTRYGRLYVWDTATTVCPNGWHLPSKAEWETLFYAVGGLSTVDEVLKSTTGWDNNANGTDAFSFAAYPAGIYAGKNRFEFLGKYAFFWSSTEDGGDSAYLLSMGAGMAQFSSIFSKDVGISVRCLKD